MFGLIDGYSVTRTREEVRKEVREATWKEARKEAMEEVGKEIQAKLENMRTDIAGSLLLENIDEEIIAKSTKLSMDKVLEIKKSLQLRESS